MEISIIIPSRRRPEMLRECLAALTKQRVKIGEILVVENDRSRHYGQLVREFPQLPIRWLQQKLKGKSKTRNLGIKKARGEVLVFLDDDCEPAADWLKHLKMAMEKQKVEVVLGESKEKKRSLLMEAYGFQYNEFFLAKRINFTTGEVSLGGALNSRNFAVKKSFLIKNDIWFDERYDRFGFAEDTDFGEQIMRKGGRMYYEKRAEVSHKDEEFLGPLLKKKFRNGRAMWLLKKKGLFVEVKVERKKRFVFERSIKLIRGRPVGEVVMLLVYLNLIILAYRLGMLYERLIKRNA